MMTMKEQNANNSAAAVRNSPYALGVLLSPDITGGGIFDRSNV
jgi:hypothetical protein